jgi:formate hydrogenlyase transcriptional activator
MQYRLRRHDGEYRWVLDNGVPRFCAQGNFAGYIGSCVDITERKQREEELQAALAEVKRLKEQLHRENEYLRQEANTQLSQDKIAGQSPAIRRILEQVEQVAATDATVLLLGETGCGKEMIASAIHDRSPRRERVMVRVNCAAIPTALIESELFGREKGAYTGALSRQMGRFELADNSTLFLDEVGGLPADVQVQLLRVLEKKHIERLGSSKPVKVDIRIITATNRDLEKSVRDGAFREDLYYRLNVFPITVPPLRERREDLPQLVWTFVNEFSKTFGKNIESISSDSLKAIQDYAWPGNVRELRNVIERAMIISAGPRLKIEVPKAKPSGPVAGATARSLTIKDTERDHILSVLEMTNWRVRGKKGAAEILAIHPSTLESRMAKLGIARKHA